jgi:hypothetical protein
MVIIMKVMSDLTAVSSDTSEQGGDTKVENAGVVGE